MFEKLPKLIFASLFLLALSAALAWVIYLCFKTQTTEGWYKVEAELLTVSLSLRI